MLCFVMLQWWTVVRSLCPPMTPWGVFVSSAPTCVGITAAASARPTDTSPAPASPDTQASTVTRVSSSTFHHQRAKTHLSVEVCFCCCIRLLPENSMCRCWRNTYMLGILCCFPCKPPAGHDECLWYRFLPRVLHEVKTLVISSLKYL